MAAAGLADGIKGVDFVSASVAPHAEILAPAFQDELKRTLGIETKIRVMERALLIEELKKGTFDMMVQTEYRSPIGDPGPGWEMCLKTGGSLNFSRYSNPEFDKLLKQINSETEQGQAQAALRPGHGAAGPDGAALPHRVHRPPADVAEQRQGPRQRSPRLLRAGSRGYVLAGSVASPRMRI